jgi:hypothetical protein
MKAKNKTVGCSDWMLGWGYGGHNKIGKLTLNKDQSFTWKGHAQGRHGQIYGEGTVTFTLDKNEISIISSDGGYPIHSVLVDSANDLLNQ